MRNEIEKKGAEKGRFKRRRRDLKEELSRGEPSLQGAVQDNYGNISKGEKKKNISGGGGRGKGGN